MVFLELSPRGIGRWIVLLTLALGAGQTAAHALAPSLLSLQPIQQPTQQPAAGGGYEVTWKTPLKRAPGSELQPILPETCERVSQPEVSRDGTGLVARWRVDCGAQGLTGTTVAVEGIGSSRADVLLRIGTEDGASLQRVLTAEEPAFTVPKTQGWGGLFQQYTVLGIEHLLTGLDHVLFVVALVLLVRAGRPLVITITSFTLGHSVTLSAAVLGYVYFPQSLAEILIAFSIMITFAGVVREDTRSFLRRWPWAIAFSFGLLHGLGFAGALTEVGLPPADIPLALLAFNVGIEVGQLLLIAALLLSALVIARVVPRLPPWRSVPGYAFGTLAGFWFWQRLLGLLA